MSVLVWRFRVALLSQPNLDPNPNQIRYVKWSLAYELPDAYRFWDALEEALKAVAAEDVQVPWSYESIVSHIMPMIFEVFTKNCQQKANVGSSMSDSFFCLVRKL